jgi:hypothetical protein
LTLYFITFTQIPDVVSDAQAIIIATGFESLPEGSDIPSDELRFATTLLIRSDQPDRILASVQEWWLEHANGPLETERLTSDEHLLSADLRQSARELAEDGWSFRDAFVAYKATSAEALAEARALLRDRAIVTH